MAEAQFHIVAACDELAPGEVRHVEVQGLEIALYNVGGVYLATADRCTHMRGRLSDGYVEGGVIECPLHFGKFDIRSGRALSAPCTQPLAVYPVRVEAGRVFVGGLPASVAAAASPKESL